MDSEIVVDDGCKHWLGAWGSSNIQEYFIGEERVYFRDNDDDPVRPLTAAIGWGSYEAIRVEEMTHML